MASKSGSVDFSDLLPDFAAADWCVDRDTSQFFNPDLFTSDDASLFRDIFWSPLPSPSSTGEYRQTFSSERLLDTQQLQAVRQNTPPSLPDTPGTSSIQPRTTVIPHDEDVRNFDPCYAGVTGAGSWVTGGTHSSAVVPTMLPPTPSVPSVTTFPLNLIKVPQRDYDHGRKQWSFKQLESISFSVGGRPGVSMGDMLRKVWVDLDGRDDPVLKDAAGAISCRFLFSGYPDYSGSCQIHALNWARKRLPITRGKLAYEVSRKLEQYLRYMTNFTPDRSVEDRWTIGQDHLHIDNIFLVRLVSVSRGSFQGEIYIADPPMPRVCAD